MSDPEKPAPQSIVGILEAAPIASSGESAPAAEPEIGFDDGDSLPPPDMDWDLARDCAEQPQNDIGNSRRLLLRHGADMLHVQAIGWHVFDGKRWCEDIDEVGTRPRCHATVEAIVLESFVLEPTPREAEEIEAGERARPLIEELELSIRELDDKDITAKQRAREKDDLRRQIGNLKAPVDRGAQALKSLQNRKTQRRRFANTSGNKGKLDAMLSEVISKRSRPIGALDADPLAFNVQNGTLRFYEVEEPDPECPDPDAVRMVKRWRVRLDPHNREDLISKIADCVYDPEATCELFDKFYARIIEQEQIRDFVQRWFGYGMTALTGEQCFVLFHGEGANGKSTLVDIIAKLMGDYAATVPIDTLVSSGNQKKGSEATPDLNALPGARAVRASEPKEGVNFDEALIKQLTAGEPIKVRRLHAEFTDVYPTFKLTISVNRKPPIRGNDDGIWRRVNLVPFEIQIPKRERDKRMPAKLWLERSGILNWLVRGALDYLNRGELDPPEAVTAATEEYRAESDDVGNFLRAACIITKASEDKVETGKLYEAFKVWCQRVSKTPIAATTFTRRMPKAATDFGIDKGKASVAVYSGLTIRPHFLPSNAPGLPPGSGG